MTQLSTVAAGEVPPECKTSTGPTSLRELLSCSVLYSALMVGAVGRPLMATFLV